MPSSGDALPRRCDPFDLLALVPVDEPYELMAGHHRSPGGVITPALVATTGADNVPIRAILQREVEVSRWVTGPGWLRVIECVEANGAFYLAYQRPAGRTLAQVLRKLGELSRRFDPHAAMFVGVELLDALGRCHDAVDEDGRRLMTVHRALSLDRVWVGFDGQVDLRGLGYAQTRQHPGIDPPGGWPASFAAPEQNRRAFDVRTDLFGVGTIIYALMTGRSELPVPRPGLERLVPELNPRLAYVVRRLTADDPADRFASAHQARDELARILFGEEPAYGRENCGHYVSDLLGEDGMTDARRERLLTGTLSPSEPTQRSAFSGGSGEVEASSARFTPRDPTDPGPGRPSFPDAGEPKRPRAIPAGGAPPAPVPEPTAPPPALSGPPTDDLLAAHRPVPEPVAAPAPGPIPALGPIPAPTPPPAPESLPPAGMDDVHDRRGSESSTAAPKPPSPVAATDAARRRPSMVGAAAGGLSLILVLVIGLNDGCRTRLRHAIVGRKPGGTLVIESIPKGADVVLNGSPIGRTTPVTAENIESELEHHIELRLAGHTAVTSTVVLEAGTAKTVTLTFPDAVVEASVASVPEDATLLVDGRKLGFTPASAWLEVGKPAVLRVEAHGYVAWEREIVPVARQPLDLNVELEKTDELKAAEAAEAASRRAMGR